MEAKLMMGFVLYVDGKATAVGATLDEAKRLAESYVSAAKQLRIESAVAPAPSQIWRYDFEIKAWVGQT